MDESHAGDPTITQHCNDLMGRRFHVERGLDYIVPANRPCDPARGYPQGLCPWLPGSHQLNCYITLWRLPYVDEYSRPFDSDPWASCAGVVEWPQRACRIVLPLNGDGN